VTRLLLPIARRRTPRPGRLRRRLRQRPASWRRVRVVWAPATANASARRRNTPSFDVPVTRPPRCWPFITTAIPICSPRASFHGPGNSRRRIRFRNPFRAASCPIRGT